MAKMRDFEGFRFGNIHSSDLDLVVVSSNIILVRHLTQEILQ